MNYLYRIIRVLSALQIMDHGLLFYNNGICVIPAKRILFLFFCLIVNVLQFDKIYAFTRSNVKFIEKVKDFDSSLVKPWKTLHQKFLKEAIVLCMELAFQSLRNLWKIYRSSRQITLRKLQRRKLQWWTVDEYK